MAPRTKVSIEVKIDALFDYLRGLSDEDYQQIMEDISYRTRPVKPGRRSSNTMINKTETFTPEEVEVATKIETSELFGLLCDVVERAWQHWTVDSWQDDPLSHTSDYARAGAARIWNALGLPWPQVTPERAAKIKAYLEKYPSDPDAGTVPIKAEKVN